MASETPDRHRALRAAAWMLPPFMPSRFRAYAPLLRSAMEEIYQAPQ